MKNICLFLLVFGFGQAFGQAAGEITPKGIAYPRYNDGNRPVAPLTPGTMIFNTSQNVHQYWNGSAWINVAIGGGGSSYWQLGGANGNEIANSNTGGFWSANPTGLTYSSNNTTNPPVAPVSGAGTRLMWIPSRSAFRVGTVDGTQWNAANIGLYSFATGYSTTASGYSSTALGRITYATGDYSTALGSNTTASRHSSTAMGYYTTASGNSSTAMGDNTTASGNGSTVMGYLSTASGETSTAMGRETTASGISSTSMGYSTAASADYSTAIGQSTTASGLNSIAMGNKTTASGDYSTAMGNNITASGLNSIALGYYGSASGELSIAIGTAFASGLGSKAIGSGVTASGNSSTAMGNGANTNFKTYAFAIGGASTTPRANSDQSYQMKMHFDNFQFLTGAANDFTITDGQITTSNQLSVFGTRNLTLSYGFLSPAGNTGTASGNFPYAIYANGRVAAHEFNAFSDARHKKLLSRGNGASDLALLNQLKVSNYTFIDTVAKGNHVQMGFIAQEVEKIVPNAVKKLQDYIPSIYDMAEGLVYDAKLKTLTVTTKKPHDFQAKDEIKLISLEKEHKVKADQIVDAHTFVVNNWEKAVDKIFVFGKQVNDFRTVDYDRLFTLGISSIQELSRKIDALQQENQLLKAKNEEFSILKNEMSELKAALTKTGVIEKVSGK